MAYKRGSGWSDITELQCLLIMKKLVRARGDAENFPWFLQRDLCIALAEELMGAGSPLTHHKLTIKVSEYKGAAGYNATVPQSRNTNRLYAEYENHSIQELERVINQMQEAE